MKKILFVLSALMIGLPALADPVSQSKATDAAAAFFNGSPATRSSVKPFLVWTGPETTRGAEPAFYVFNNPDGGWVVVAGENSGRAILAWSERGVFDPIDMPESTAEWFQAYADEIESARAHRLSPSEESASEWAELMEGRIRRAAVKTLSDMANWNQGSPYNVCCPRIVDSSSVSYSSGSRTITGCVGTATAIVMRHFQHPAQGKGSLGGYEDYIYSSVFRVVPDPAPVAPTINLDDDADGYDWANMPLNKPSTDAEEEAVGKLMFHACLGVKTQFGRSASSSQLHRIQSALVNRFKYDPSMRIVARTGYNLSTWLGLFKTELDADRPVMISGRKKSGSGGHLFVAQGYDSNDRILINWGWGGSRNGYFALSYFKTTAEDASGSDYRYSQQILIGIKPDEGGTRSHSLTLYDTGFGLASAPNLSSPESNFGVRVMIINRGGFSSTFDLRVYVADYAGTYKAVSCVERKKDKTLSPTNSLYWSNWTCNLRNRTSPRLGDKLIVCYNVSGSEDSKDYVQLLGTSTDYNDNIPLFDTPFIAVKDGGVYSVGDYFDFELVNTRTTRGERTVRWYFDGERVYAPDESTSHRMVKLTAPGDHIIKAVVTIAGETQTLVQKIHVE